MKAIVTGLLAIAFCCAAGASAPSAADASAYHPIRPVSSCLSTDSINEWYLVDARTAIVRTGPRRYLVRLQTDCPRLIEPPQGLIFHSSPANQAVLPGRICGEAGETVRSYNQPPCQIQSVSKIDKARFDALRKRALHRGHSAAHATPSH